MFVIMPSLPFTENAMQYLHRSLRQIANSQYCPINSILVLFMLLFSIMTNYQHHFSGHLGCFSGRYSCTERRHIRGLPTETSCILLRKETVWFDQAIVRRECKISQKDCQCYIVMYVPSKFKWPIPSVHTHTNKPPPRPFPHTCFNATTHPSLHTPPNPPHIHHTTTPPHPSHPQIKHPPFDTLLCEGLYRVSPKKVYSSFLGKDEVDVYQSLHPLHNVMHKPSSIIWPSFIMIGHT